MKEISDLLGDGKKYDVKINYIVQSEQKGTGHAVSLAKNQRLDTPYKKKRNKFEKISWKEAYKSIFDKISSTSSNKIAGVAAL